MLDRGEIAAIGDEMLKLDQDTLQWALKASFDARPEIDIEDLQSLSTTTQMQILIRRGGIESFLSDAWPTGPSRAIASWIQINAPILQAYDQRAMVLKEILERLGLRYP